MRQRDRLHTAAPAACRGRGRVGCCGETFRREIGSVCETGRLAAYDSQARTAIATGDQFFDSTIVETSARRAPILYEHLGEVTPIAQGAIEGRLQHTLIHQGLAHVSIVSA